MFYIFEIFNGITLNNAVKLYIKLFSLLKMNMSQQSGTDLENPRSFQRQNSNAIYDMF